MKIAPIPAPHRRSSSAISPSRSWNRHGRPAKSAVTSVRPVSAPLTTRRTQQRPGQGPSPRNWLVKATMPLFDFVISKFSTNLAVQLPAPTPSFGSTRNW